MNVSKYIRSFLVIALLTLSCLFSYAQKDDGAAKKLNEIKVGFFTEKLDLTSEEAEKFWPVYNEYSKAKIELRDKYKGSDDADAMVEQKEEEASLLKSYNEKFKEILPNEKVSLLHKAESELKKMIFEEIKKRNKTN